MNGSILLCVCLIASVVSGYPLREEYAVRRDPKTSFDVCGTWSHCSAKGDTVFTKYVFNGKKGEFPDTFSEYVVLYGGTTCTNEASILEYIRKDYTVTRVETNTDAVGDKKGSWLVSWKLKATYVRVVDLEVTCEGITIDPKKEYNVMDLRCKKGANDQFEDLKSNVQDGLEDITEFPYGANTLYLSYSTIAPEIFTRVDNTGCASNNLWWIILIVVVVVVIIIIVVVVILVVSGNRKKGKKELPTSSAAKGQQMKADAKATTDASAAATVDTAPTEVQPEPAQPVEEPVAAPPAAEEAPPAAEEPAAEPVPEQLSAPPGEGMEA